jgi:hydroxyacyl-ACP dehydratase HTD2-like protein with hotdog domain
MCVSIIGLHLDDRTHPGMDAALEVVIADAETGHARAGARSQIDGRHRHALRSRRQAQVERRNASSPEVLDLREGMDSAAVVLTFTSSPVLIFRYGGSFRHA